MEVFKETFWVIFVAELGDKSMISTVALAAAQNPYGVFVGEGLYPMTICSCNCCNERIKNPYCLNISVCVLSHISRHFRCISRHISARIFDVFSMLLYAW